MTVNLIISGTTGGDSLADTVDVGTEVSPDEDTSTQDIFVRHDAIVNPITDCAWYVTRYVGSDYQGIDADADFVEMMAWGDEATGGATINQEIPAGWTIGDPFHDPDDTFDDVFSNSNGDINSQIPLAVSAINIGTPAGAGVLPVSGEAHVQVRVQVPASVPAGAGYRAFSLVFAYSATS